MTTSNRIVFATFGSLGDLHPYVAIAQALARRKHRPLIATFEEFRENVEAAGVEFAPLRPDMTRFGDKAAFMERDRKSTRLNSSHIQKSRMPSSA